MRRSIVVVVASAILLPATPALGASDEDRDNCNQTANHDLKIDGCTRILNDREEPAAHHASTTTTAPSPTSTRRSGLIPNSPLLTSTAASPGTTSATATAPSPTSTRRSGLIPNTPLPTTAAAPSGTTSATATAPSPTSTRRSGL